MFSIPGIVLLIVFILLKPQEYITSLRQYSLLYPFLGLAVIGFMIDLRIRRIRPSPTPQLKFVALFLLWCLVTVAMRVGGLVIPSAINLLIPITIFLIIAHGVQTFRAFQVLAGMLLCLTIFLDVVGVEQGLSPLGCFRITESGKLDKWDGRICVKHRECEEGEGAEPGAEYECEHIGLFGTQSIGGRVRYLGTLEDPNEVALVVSVGLPFAFSFFERKRSTKRLIVLIVTFALTAVCDVFTQSRGGQLVFLAVIGAYFIKKYGIAGIAAGGVLAVPILLLGGRDGTEAAASSQERLQCWHEGMAMFRDHPISGVGQGLFTEHHFLTAHNSYVLAAAELGFVGIVIFSILLYVAVKIPVHALIRLGPARGDGSEADVARTWGMALLASWCGLILGIFFLSFCYKEFLWTFYGLSGAYYSAMQSHDEGYEITFGWKDLFIVASIDAVLLAVLYVYTALKTY